MEKTFSRTGQTGNKPEYKGYFGAIDFDAANRIFTGHIEGTIQRITFHGSGVDELKAAFRGKVDQLIEDLSKQGDL
jgi:predicted HicB family RNase H-like nuclease